MPRGRENWRAGAIVSFGLHLLILALIAAPLAFMADITLIEQGAGGPGPAGGGGGGTSGSGGVRHESLRYLTVAAAEPARVVSEVEPPPPPEPALQLPELPRVEPPKVTQLSPITGIGGGIGNDGTAGTGAGSGGGVGSGVGTGRGSGTGSGTGGGAQGNYPPTAMEMFIPPMPVPPSARGFHVVVQFDVDETGTVRAIEFTPTPDRGYNRRLRQVFDGFRFRPGTRPDGTPIRMKYQLEIDLP